MNRTWKHWSARALCAGWASISLVSCSVLGGTTGPEPPPVVAALTLSDANGMPLADPLRPGLGSGLTICAYAKDPAGGDVTYLVRHELRVSSTNLFVVNIDLVDRSLLVLPGVCAMVSIGRVGVATLLFEHVRDRRTGATARVTINTTGT